MGYMGYTVYTVYPVTFDVFNRFAPPYPPNSNFAEIVCQIVFLLCEIFLKKVHVLHKRISCVVAT